MTADASAPTVRLDVRFAGSIGCASFPNGCIAALSVLGPGTVAAEAWRSGPSDPWWAPDWNNQGQAERFDPIAVGGVPRLAPGSHRIVISILGGNDTPSFNPDGSRAYDLLGRCWTDIDAQIGSQPVARITTHPDPASFRATCSIDVAFR